MISKSLPFGLCACFFLGSPSHAMTICQVGGVQIIVGQSKGSLVVQSRVIISPVEAGHCSEQGCDARRDRVLQSRASSMSEVHAQARTTPRTRTEIKESTATLAELAERYNISKLTARKWKNRESPEV